MGAERNALPDGLAEQGGGMIPAPFFMPILFDKSEHIIYIIDF
jgi:hypothetical protein